MSISFLLIQWYLKNKRDLPWRNSKNPYSIWMSEIILQQTRVNQGLPYYIKFMNAYPTIEDFSKANEDDILKLWQGLGYYSRARNMHKAAKYIVQNHHGHFPKDIPALLAIPGVGPYTANAIASMAFDKSVPVVDGNVFRVLSRLLEIDDDIRKQSSYSVFYNAAFELMGNSNPSDFNQAIMELGALICLPKSPNCISCPVVHHCGAYSNKSQLSFPVNIKKNKIKHRHFNYLVLLNQNRTLIYQRLEKDIWQNLWEFPLIETAQKILQPAALMPYMHSLLSKEQKTTFYKCIEFNHVLTHQKINAIFWIFQVEDLNQAEDKFELVDFDKINIKFALSRLTHKFITSNI
jgi:A/G-specific adenine glycosylase